MRIALRAPSGYLTAEAIGPDDAGTVTANRSQVGAWEIWTVQWMGPDQIALLGAHGFFLCAENAGSSVLSCNRVKAQSWETFFVSGPLADGSHITLQASDHLHYVGIGVDGEHVAHARGGPTTFTVEVIEADAPTVTALSPLHLDGNQLRNDAGLIFLRGSDLFAGFEIYLHDGEAPLRSVLDELQAYRCNLVRVWLMSKNLQTNEFNRAAFDPRTYGDDFYPAIPAFAQFLAHYGMYPYFGLFPDVGLIMPSLEPQRLHRDICCQVITSGLVEYQNEAAAHDFNRMHPDLSILPHPKVPFCVTSYSDSDPAYASGTLPAADWGGTFGDLHPARRYPSHILDCCPANNIYFKSNKGLLIGEGDRYGWRGNPNARQAELSANAARAGAMGMIFHSMRGERCENFDAAETKPCADKFFGAFGAI